MAMTPRTLLSLLLVIAISAVAITSSSAEDVRYKVIVHPANPATSVSSGFVRDAFLKKSLEWGSGEAIRPVDLAWRFPERRRFTEGVLRKTPAQLKNYWNQQIFSGKGVPPPEADSAQAAIAYVLANPGALAYVPVGVDSGGAKVIPIR
jgi:hypothetical protein